MKLLHIDSSVLGPHSVSRQVTAAIVKRLTDADSRLAVTYRDLGTSPLAHLSGQHWPRRKGLRPIHRSGRISRPDRRCWRNFSPPMSL